VRNVELICPTALTQTYIRRYGHIIAL